MVDLFAQAMAEFDDAYRRAHALGTTDASLVALATADRRGRPSNRMVTFTGLQDGCLTFFANRSSGKGHQMASNPRAGLCFYWPGLSLQVVIEGDVTTLSSEQSDHLWNSRARSSALMSWASLQSSPGDGLKERYQVAQRQFRDERVPRPPDWIAFAVRPNRIEFWRGGWQGKRQRDAYLHTDDGWKHQRLDP